MKQSVRLDLPHRAELSGRHRGAAEGRAGRGAWHGVGRRDKGSPQKWLVTVLSRDKLEKIWIWQQGK